MVLLAFGQTLTVMMEYQGTSICENIDGPKKNDEASSAFLLQSIDEKMAYNVKSDNVRVGRAIEYAIYGIDIYKPFDENERYD